MKSVEFGVCLKDKKNSEQLGLIPVDREVQEVLISMLSSTKTKLKCEVKGQKQEKFEYSQKYSDQETLYMPFDDENLAKIKEIYYKRNIDTCAGFIKEIKKIWYYFVIFTGDKGEKVIAFRKAAQFKGVIKSK